LQMKTTKKAHTSPACLHGRDEERGEDAVLAVRLRVRRVLLVVLALTRTRRAGDKQPGTLNQMRRHAHAVVLLVWVLMVPPSQSDIRDGRPTVTVDKDAPISRWSQDSAYDSARECQAGLAALAKRTIPDAMLPIYIAARCVPAEAVYPPKDPASK
jgi:hypothetical protein